MQTVLTIKKWHAENNQLLEKLISQSHEIISAKDTVFGVGGRSGVRSKPFLPYIALFTDDYIQTD